MLIGRLFGRLALGLAATVVLVGAMGAAAASPGPLGEGFRHTKLGEFVMGKIGRAMVLKSELGLSDEQRTKLREIVRSHKGEFLPVVKDLAAKKHALRDAVLAENPDKAAIKKASDDLAGSINDMAVLVSNVVGEARPVLTDEQRAQVREFLTEQDGALNKFLESAP